MRTGPHTCRTGLLIKAKVALCSALQGAFGEQVQAASDLVVMGRKLGQAVLVADLDADVTDVLVEGVVKIVVALAAVSFLDSVGIGALVAARRWLTSRGATMTLACADKISKSHSATHEKTRRFRRVL